MQTLTEEQKNFIKRNMPIVSSYIHKTISKKHIPAFLLDEFESDILFYFCRAVLTFDAKKGFKFSTYAYGAFDFAMKKFYREYKVKFLKSNYKPNKQILNIKKSLEFNIDETKINSDYVNLLIRYANLTDKEKNLLDDYFFKKKTLKDIGEITGVSKARVHQLLVLLLDKIRRAVRRKKLSYNDFYISGENIWE